MREFLFYIGITATGVILYVIGTLLTRGRYEGGKRTVLAVTGIGSAVLGLFTTKCCLGEDSSIKYLVVLGIGMVGFGIYLFAVALFTSQENVRKVFDGILRGW